MLIRMIVAAAVLAGAYFVTAAQELIVAPTAPGGAPGSAHTYRVDPVHSTVIFRIKHNSVAYFYGRFNEIAGTIEWNEDDPSAGALDIRINAASVDTANERRDNHLRSDDFFSADQYPEIAFKTTGIEKRGDKLRASGELTMRGVTRPISVDLEHTGTATNARGSTLIGFHSIFTIKRTEFEMPYGVEAGALGDEVTLMIGLEGVRR